MSQDCPESCHTSGVPLTVQIQTSVEADDAVDVELTILMPCLNEAETIATCVAKAQGFLARTSIDGEVLVADNGSRDGSQDIAKGLGARVVDVPQRGYGAALIEGIRAARGRYIIMGDADDSYDFSALDHMVSQLRDGAELVMGNRFAGGIKARAMPRLHRYLGNPVLSFIGRLFFRSDIGDFHCGLRGFRTDAARSLDLRTTGMEFASELVIKSTLAKQRIVEVPVVLHPDGRSRPPHLRSWRDGWRHLRFLLLYSPRWLLFYPGLITTVVASILLALLALGVWAPGRGRFAEGALIGVGGLVLVGFQTVQFSVLARVFAETQGLLPPMRRRVSSVLDRVTFEAGLVGGVTLCVLAVVGVIESILLSRGSDPYAHAASAAVRLGAVSVVVGILGLQALLGAIFLSILRLNRLGVARPKATKD